MTQKWNNLSPRPLPLQGKGAKKKRGGEAPSLKGSSPSPGPEDNRYLFGRFLELVRGEGGRR